MFQSGFIEQVALFAIEKHNGQNRKDGSAYIQHPIRVGMKASKFVTHGHREFVMAGGLLHDVMEDCDVQYNDLRLKFSRRIADLVQHLTKTEIKDVETMNDTDKFFAQVEEERKRMLKADYYAKVVKVADILDNTQSLTDDVVQWDRDKLWATNWLLKKHHTLNVLTDVAPGLFEQTQAVLYSRLKDLHPQYEFDRRYIGPR